MIRLHARRCAASAVDGAVALLLAVLMGHAIGGFFAGRAVVALRIHDPDSLWKGPVPMVMGILGEIVYLLPLTLLLVLLAEPLSGRTPGKSLLRLDVIPQDGAVLWLRFLVKASGPLLCLLGLLVGRWEIAAVGAAASAAIPAGFIIGLGLHDRVAGTRVVIR